MRFTIIKTCSIILFFNTDFQDGTEVDFYPSGEVQSYCVYYKGKITGIYYEWYENGMIKKIKDYSENDGHCQYTEFNRQGKITRQCVL